MSELAKFRFFMGLDQSYGGFGIVILDSKGIIQEHELMKFTKKDGDGERLRIISDYLQQLFTIYRARYPNIHITMEGYSFESKLNREKLGELGGVVKLAVHDVFNMEPTCIPPTTLKKFLTGKGNASKELMVSTIQQTYPEISNNNIADALGLALYAIAHI